MTVTKPLALAALVVLLVITAIAISREGMVGMLTPFNASFWTWQFFIDLVIALGLVMIWMWRDCVARGKSPLPWIGATLLTGSVAPLVYLLLRNNDISSSQ